MTEQMILALGGALMDQAALYALPLIGSVMLAYAVFNLIHDLRKVQSKKVAERLREPFGGMGESENERAVKESILRRTHEATGLMSMALSKLTLVPKLQRMLEQANLPWSATSFLVNVIGFTAVTYIVGYFLKWSQAMSIGMALLVLLFPFIVIYFKRKRRLNKFMTQLPDVFELMGQGLRAGHSLANSIMLIGQQLPDPAGTEFARVFHEQNLGIKVEESLQNMASRIGLLDVRFFVTAVLIQRQTGGDLAEVLDNIGSVIRERLKLFGMVKALTAEGRLSGWVLLALPVVCLGMELVVNPTYADVLLNDPIGQYMLMAAGISQLLGLAMIQKIVNIKV
ncbi:MAG TPA: type II secretion system F family protein [Phycisphaerae bacterium]|nr:type II secretion system F family protein [Phycisphaerae bacterium]